MSINVIMYYLSQLVKFVFDRDSSKKGKYYSIQVFSMLQREKFSRRDLADFVRIYFREYFNMKNLARIYFRELRKKNGMFTNISNRIGLICRKKHGKLMKELNLAFSIPCLYTKHRNDKHEAFIDVDSNENNFFATAFRDLVKSFFSRGFNSTNQLNFFCK